MADDKQLVIDFAGKTARVMKKISSSHVYFIIQEGFGDIDWSETEKILKDVIRLTPGVKLKRRKY